MEPFKQRKESILSKEDKSAKGSWDSRIVELCEKINSLEKYYTTSSCSGKCVVMEDKIGKDGSYYLWTSHDEIRFKELREVLGKVDYSKKMKFKQEGPILHVACKDLIFAQKLVDLARKIGFKRSGIITSVDKIIIELSSPEKLEFPLVEDLSDEFLEKIVEEANRKLKVGWDKIGELKGLFD